MSDIDRLTVASSKLYCPRETMQQVSCGLSV